MNADDSHRSPQAQSQSIGDVRVDGDDNIFNVVQGQTITLNQTKIIQISVDKIKTEPLNEASPYQGLKPFEPTDSDRFFGRDQFLTGLVNELEKTNLLLLLGASGSGKSSVVRAGLIPFLSRTQGNRLVSLMMTPDDDPFESLYGSLLGHAFKQSDARVLRAGTAESLPQVVQTLKRPNQVWLILVDQFEELFTTSRPEKRDAFIRGLVKLSQLYAADPSLKIVATMRSDFLDRLDPSPANLIARATEGHRPLITQMHPDEMRLAIEQPAAHHGVVFERGLVEEIIKDVQGQAGYLPLLQYTLNLLWETEAQADGLQDRTLNISTYRQLGGVRGALQQRVDEIYTAFSDPKRAATQRIFLKLVEIGGDAESGTEWHPVRRRAALSEFTDDLENQVLVELIAANLLISDTAVVGRRQGRTATQRSTVEIAHEVLLSSWSTLNTWIADNRQAIALRNRLEEDVSRWQTNQSESELWGGSKLEQALELRDNSTFKQVLGGFGRSERRFIEASKRLRERRRQRTIASLLGFSAVALTLAAVAGFQWRQAATRQIEALVQSSNARFALNAASLDPLLDAVEAGDRLQQLPFGRGNSQLYAEVTESLSQTLFWVQEKTRLEEHDNFVQKVAFSPDGQRIATASYDHTVKLWRRDGAAIATLEGHSAPVLSVRFSPDGQRIASASEDQTIIIWDLAGNRVHTLEGHGHWVNSVAFNPDGSRLASASDDTTVKLWDRDGRLVNTIAAHDQPVLAVAYSPDGTRLATASLDGTAKLWDAQGNFLHRLEGHQDILLDAAFSPDGRFLATASNDSTVKLWTPEGTHVSTLSGPEGFSSVTFSPDGRLVAAACFDDTIRIWTVEGQAIATLTAHPSRINSVSFSPDGAYLASASNDFTAKLWQLENAWAVTVGESAVPVFSIASAPDGTFIASTARSTTAANRVELWDSQGNPIRDWETDTWLYSLAVSPDSTAIAGADAEGTVWLWTPDGEPVNQFSAHDAAIRQVSFNSDGTMLATASEDGTARLWTPSGQPLGEFVGHTATVSGIDFHPSTPQVVTASDDGTVRLWTLDGTLLQTLEGHSSGVAKVQFRPDGRAIASAGGDGTVRLWTAQGEPVTTGTYHTAAVTDVAFSSDGALLASSSDDGTIILWDHDGNVITTFAGHQDEVNTVQFVGGDRALISGDSDGRIILSDVTTLTLERLMTRGCDWLENYLETHPDARHDMCN